MKTNKFNLTILYFYSILLFIGLNDNFIQPVQTKSLLDSKKHKHFHFGKSSSSPAIFEGWTINDFKSYLKDHSPEYINEKADEYLSKETLKELEKKAAKIWHEGYDATLDTVSDYSQRLFEYIEPQPWYKRWNPFVSKNLNTRGLEKYQDVKKKSGEKLKEASEEIGEYASDKAADAGKYLKDYRHRVYKDVIVRQPWYKRWNPFVAKSSHEKGRDKLQDLKKQSGKKLDEISENVKEKGQVVQKKGAEKLHELKKDSVETGSSIISKVSESGSSIASVASDVVVTKGSELKDTISDKTSEGYDSLKHTLEDKKKDISEWLFNTWNTVDLENFLKANGVQVAENIKENKDALIKLCKKNFKQISSKLENSGYYITDSYFNSWDIEDMKAWLKENHIKFKDSAELTKKDLQKIIKKNIYKVSSKMDDLKFDTLKNLHLEDYNVFDTKKTPDVNVFENWSIPDLQKWFKLHGIKWKYSLKEGTDVIYEDANKHLDLLQEDAKWYLDKMSKDFEKNIGTNPGFLTKSKNQVTNAFGSIYESFKNSVPFTGKKGKSASSELADNVINDTFLVGVEKWPIERIKSFLNSRNIKYKTNASKKDLISLLTNNRNKKLTNFNKQVKKIKDTLNKAGDVVNDNADDEWFFQNWSLDNLKQWVHDYNPVSSKPQPELSILEKANHKLSNLVSTAHDDLSDLWETTFQKWSIEDLKKYVSGFGYSSDNMSKEEMLQIAKENTLWFLSGGKYERTKDKSYYQRSKDYINYAFQQVPFINS